MPCTNCEQPVTPIEELDEAAREAVFAWNRELWRRERDALIEKQEKRQGGVKSEVSNEG